MFLLIFIINLFNIRYREYIKIYDKTNIEMRDFTVLVENLPFDYQYGGKDIILQAYLWEHFEYHTRQAFEAVHIKNNNEAKLEELRQTKPWEIVDITFGKIDTQEWELLNKLDQAERTKKTKINQINVEKKKEQPNEEKVQKVTEEISAPSRGTAAMAPSTVGTADTTVIL